MSNQGERVNIWIFRIISLIFLGVAVISLLGAFGITKVGQTVFLMFNLLPDGLSWVGPFSLMCLSLLFWVIASVKDPANWESDEDEDEDTDEDENQVFPEKSYRSNDKAKARVIAQVDEDDIEKDLEDDTEDDEVEGYQFMQKRPAAAARPSRLSREQERKRASEPVVMPAKRIRPTYQESPRTPRREQKEKSLKMERQRPAGVPLPPTKLVSLKGFNQYFASDEWVETLDAPQKEPMDEVGRDFPTYFGEGQKPGVRFPQKLGSKQGLKNYFREVDTELYRENKQAKGESPRPEPSFPVLNLNLEEEKVNWFSKLNGHLEAYTDGVNQPPVAFTEDEESFAEVSVLINEEPEAQYIETNMTYANGGAPINTNANGATTINGNAYAIGNTNINANVDSNTIANNGGNAGSNQSVNVNDLNGNIDTKVNAEDYGKLTGTLGAALGTAGVIGAAQAVNQSAAGAEAVETGWRGQAIHWYLPPLSLLDPPSLVVPIVENDTSAQLENVLQDFGVKAKVIRVVRGPVITRYELTPAPGVKISKIVNLADDIALALAARDVRIEAPIPGKSAIGIEVPNKKPRAVLFREVLETSGFQTSTSKLKAALGKDISDQAVVADLARMPHLLVAGATGSGKSVCVTALINSVLFNATPNEVKFLMIDPKMVELNSYNGIPHLLAPVVTDPKKASAALKWIVKEMETRYELFAAAGVRDIERYNLVKNTTQPAGQPALPYILVIIDELADLMLVAAGEVEEAICRLAQMARAAGIHLVIATQRPSVDVITGLIKANIPSRISFAVTSQIDSRTILDSTGAEKLLGRGDMLYSPQGVNKPVRVQGCLVTDDEVNRVIDHWKRQGKPEYLDPDRLFSESGSKGEESGGPDDDLFIEAGQLLITTKMASTSFLQRRMKLGYSRAARLIDMLEEQGVVGPYEGSKPRQILLTLEEFNERFG